MAATKTKTGKVRTMVFSVECATCGECVQNPKTGSYSFDEGGDLPQVGETWVAEWDCGHTIRMPKW